MRFTTRETSFKDHLIRQAGVKEGHRVLDLGCGTGTLILMIKKMCPEAEVVGLDGDMQVLELASTKITAAGLSVRLDHGPASILPYADNSFDRVLSSLLIHHLSRPDKMTTFGEVLRVLQPGGEFHIADWGKARNALTRLAFLGVQLLDGFGPTGDNVKGLLPEFLTQAGFAGVGETKCYTTPFGTLSVYKARKPLSCGAD